MAEEQVTANVNSIGIASEITVAWLSKPNVSAAANDVPAFLKAIHATIGELSSGTTTETAAVPTEFVPAVPVRSSVKPDYIISLINGRKFKTLKRHLALHGLTPAEYRERYGLKSDYPMVAPSYSEHRREVAWRLGLGRKPAVVASQAAPESVAAKPKRGAAKARAVKPATPKASAASAKIASEKESLVAPGVSEAVNSDAVPTPGQSKRGSAKSRVAKDPASSVEAVASSPAPKKPRAVLKPQYLPKAEDATGAAAVAPKRRFARKQPVEA